MIESIFRMFVPGIRLMFGLGFWAAAPVILAAAGLGLSAYEQKKARKEAKEAAAKQAQQDAWENLMSAAGGQGLARAKPIEAPPSYSLGPSVLNLGTTAMSYAQKNAENEAQRKAKAEQIIAKQKAEDEANRLPSAEATARLAQGQGGKNLPAELRERYPWAGGISQESDDLEKMRILQIQYQNATPQERPFISQQLEELMKKIFGQSGGGTNASAGGTNAPAFSYQF